MPQLRIGGYTNVSVGRVEINVYGEWGDICDSSLDDNDAKVICRQMGLGTRYSRILTLPSSAMSERIVYGDLNCNGDEDRVDLCEHVEYPNDCSHTGNVAIVCTDYCECFSVYY